MIQKCDCWVTSNCIKFVDGECKDEEPFCKRLYKLDALYNNSLLSFNQRKKLALKPDSDGTDRDKFTILRQYEEHIEQFVNEGKNLFIYSDITGNGKTSWAIRFIQAYFNATWYKSDLGCHALFINVPRFMIELKNSFNQDSEYINLIRDNIYKAELVVWDEIGSKVATDFEHENLLSMIDKRLELGKANVYTSNMSGEPLKARIGDRLYSRVVNFSNSVELNGLDKRSVFK